MLLVSFVLSLSLKPTIMERKNIIKAIVYLATALATTIAIALGTTSCNLTRIVTTEAQHITKGDTTTTIVTKTTETYDASRKQ